MAKRFASILLFLTILSVCQGASRTRDVAANNVTVSPSTYDSMPSANVSSGPWTEPPDPLGAMDIDWNSVVDYVLTELREEILSRGNDEIVIPDIDHEFFRGSGFIRGWFHATGGRLGRLSSLYRAGDVIVTQSGGPAYRLTCAVGLRELHVHYDQYVARVWGHGPRGDITGAVGSSAIRVAVTFHVAQGGECTATLDELSVTQLDDIAVRVTGMGFLNGLASRVASTRLAKRKAALIESVEDRLSREMTNMLEGFRCDEYLGMLVM